MANYSRPYPPERCNAETMAYLLDLEPGGRITGRATD